MRFDFVGAWKSYRLEELVEMCGGGTPSTSNSDYWNGNIPWISSSDLVEDNIHKINISRFISNDAINNSATKYCPEGTICIVSRVGVGKVAVSKTGICTSQDFANIISFQGNKYFLAQSIQNKIKSSNQQGTSIKGITSKEIKQFRISIPSLNEQDKIMDILNKVDQRIELQNKIIEEYQYYINIIKERLIRKYCNYECVKVKDICKISTGKLDANAMVPDGKYRFYTCAEKYSFIDHYAFDTEALLISGNGANVGYINYYNGKFNAYQRTYVLTDFMINPSILKLNFDLYLKRRINNQKNVGNTPYIKLDTLSEMEIYVCEPKNVNNITKAIDRFEKILEIETRILDEFEFQKRYLLQNMFI